MSVFIGYNPIHTYFLQPPIPKPSAILCDF